MANTKISNLTGAASVTDNSVFPVVDSGSTKKVTGTQIKTYARSGLSTVAVSGSYADLSNKPTIFDGNYNNLTNKPTLFDGSYTSLTSKPTLFDGNYNSLTNKPALFDGSYNSLSDTPTIFDGNYDGLTNKPIISDTTGLTGGTFFIAKDSTTIQLGQWAAQAITIGSSGIQIAGTGGVEIAGVAGAGITLGGETSGTITFDSATSGINYNDLINKPTIPADISDLTDTTSLLGQGGGAPGQGVPTGGTTGQILAKVDGSDYNTEWVDLPSTTSDRLVNGSSEIVLGTNGALTMPSAGNGSTYHLSPSAAQTVGTGAAPTVVYTSSGQFVTGIKAVISVMTTGDLIGGTQITDTQISEMLVTIRYTNVNSVVTKTAVGSVYGVTHTSASPLATFTVNVLNDNLQILAEPTNLVVSGMTVQVVATELLGTP